MKDSAATAEKSSELSAEEQEKSKLRTELDELDGTSSTAFAEEELDTTTEESNSDTDTMPNPQGDQSPLVSGDGGTVQKIDSPTGADLAGELEKLKGELGKKDKELHRLGRLTSDLHNRLKEREHTPASGAMNQNEIEPEVKQTISSVYQEEKMRERMQVYRESEDDLLDGGVEKADYDEAVNSFFLPAVDRDPKLARRFARSNDPASFAYEEGKKIRETVRPSPDKVVLTKAELDAKIAEAKAEGQRIVSSEVQKGSGIISSLSSVGGGLPTQKRSSLRKELDEL